MKTMKQEIKAHRCTMIDTNFSIDLRHETKNAENNGNLLGQRLAWALKEVCLVGHSV
jgi:hypothetical protein